VSRRTLTEEERELWRGIARSVKPLRKRAKRATANDGDPASAAPPKAAKPAKPVKSAKTVARPAPAPVKPPGPPPLAPLPRREKQQLARGRTGIDKRIDLHGMTQAQAHAALAYFLRDAQHDGAKFVLVITGKGARGADPDRGVLRRQVPHWLGLPDLREIVLGFEEAHVTHGGEGALYVRLRRMK
jgi:DNA-nicking Smr family endonuclease